MALYATTDGTIYKDTDTFVNAEGTTFSRQYPKSEIPELHLVTEVPAPTGDDFVATDWVANEANNYVQTWNTRPKTEEEIASDLAAAKTGKINDLLVVRETKFAALLFCKTVEDVDCYLKPSPQVNIFLAGYAMEDNETKDWYACDASGVKFETPLVLSKAELISMAKHYEIRKTSVYNLYNAAVFQINALATIAEVRAFDVNQVFE